MPILKLHEVYKTYIMGQTEVKALQGIDIKIEKGDFVCIEGPSGSGKSTLLNLIGCLDKPTKGQLWFLDEYELATLSDTKATHLRREKIGFIFQNFNLFPVLDVIENIELPMIMLGIDSKASKKRVNELIEAVGLSDCTHRRPSELSGGQQQRVAIARALVSNPKLVLADEPTANLDSHTSAQILDLMEKMNCETKTTFIFSTHDPNVMKRARLRIHLLDGQINNVKYF